MAPRLPRTFTLVCVAVTACLVILFYPGITLFPLNTGISLESFKKYDFGGSHTPTDASRYPVGRPHARIRDSLRNDTNYITSWAGAGYTNQFMSHVNMIYLGFITNRIPIIAPFSPPPHIEGDLEVLPFGNIYDLQHLREKLQIPILEWRDLKTLTSDISPEVEEIGCWTTSPEDHRGVPEIEPLVRHLGVDTSYTRVPISARFQGANLQSEIHVAFNQLAAVIFPEEPLTRADDLKVLQASRVSNHERTPDVQLSCFDTMYYATSGVRAFEWQKSWSPAWQIVGKNLYYTPRLQRLGQEYVRRAFGIPESLRESYVPPFIALHIRHGDFGERCLLSGGTVATCFPPVSTYVKHVDAIKQKWLERNGLAVTNVLVMSDEQDPTFWDDVRAQGWVHTNHTEQKTAERLGGWYPTIIDTVIQSLAVGLVGTQDSTYTLVGQRRVRDWNQGFTSEVNVRL